MNPTLKIEILNKAADNLRKSLHDIDEIFKDDKDVSYFTWKISKLITEMHKVICKVLDKEITDEEFRKIVKINEEE